MVGTSFTVRAYWRLSFRDIEKTIEAKLKTIIERMDEGFKLIARLIVEENEKTRREILKALES